MGDERRVVQTQCVDEAAENLGVATEHVAPRKRGAAEPHARQIHRDATVAIAQAGDHTAVHQRPRRTAVGEQQGRPSALVDVVQPVRSHGDEARAERKDVGTEPRGTGLGRSRGARLGLGEKSGFGHRIVASTRSDEIATRGVTRKRPIIANVTRALVATRLVAALLPTTACGGTSDAKADRAHADGDSAPGDRGPTPGDAADSTAAATTKARHDRAAAIAALTDPGQLAYDPTGPEPVATEQPPVEHARATAALTSQVEVVGAIELDHPLVDRLYALAAEVGVPAWAHASTWDPHGARDDDGRTAWRCKSTGNAHCGWIATFPEPAQVAAVRIVVGRGKVRALRLHTDAGQVELAPLPNAKPRYIVLDPPVETSSIALEAVRPGSVRLADVEIYGISGKRRAAWSFDPSSAAVAAEKPWHPFGETWRLGRYVCLSVLDAGVTARCLFRGTAMYGSRGDRFALQETIFSTDCARHVGMYTLVDRETRRRIKVGALGGTPSPIFRHAEGLGFASARPEGGYFAAMAEGDAVRVTKLDDEAALRAAGFETTGHRRGEFALRAPAECPADFPESSTSVRGEPTATGDGPEPVAPVAVPAQLPRALGDLPEAARDAIADELDEMCVDGIDPGNFAGTGIDDHLVHAHACDEPDDRSSWLLLRTDLGDYLPLAVPSSGGRVSFDRLADGKRVLLVDDDCCGGHRVAIVEQGRGSTLLVTQSRQAPEGQSVKIVRDDQGRIVRLKPPGA